jgi:hypothetical protein
MTGNIAPLNLCAGAWLFLHHCAAREVWIVLLVFFSLRGGFLRGFCKGRRSRNRQVRFGAREGGTASQPGVQGYSIL